MLITSAFIPSYNNIPTRNNNNLTRRYMNLAPLKQDTVSFGATKKDCEDSDRKLYGVNLTTAKNIHNDAKDSEKYLKNQLSRVLGNLVRPESGTGSQSRPIKEIKYRIKRPKSIQDKSISRRWNNTQEIKENMTDIVGARVVMADASTKNVDKVIERITDAVKSNTLRILEIENYRQDPDIDDNGNIVKTFDYASPKALKGLKDACTKMGYPVKKKDEDLLSGYMAIHLLVQLPNGYIGEIQIMGSDVEHFKEVEDICFKVKNNKSVDPIYNPVKKMLQPLKDKDDIYLQTAYDEYTRRSYRYQREIEPNKSKNPKAPEFLHIPDDLDYIPEKFDFNYIYEKMQQCEGRNKNKKKN